MTPLYGEINRWMTLPFIWGETDCALVCCDWVERVTGTDPAAEIRMTYHSPGTCQKETGFLRDPVGAASRYLEAAGLPRTADPVAGDVGVVKAMQDGVVRPVMGLCLGGGRWAIKSQNGVTTLSQRAVLGVMQAWSVGYA